jgi:hypothetical protein
MLRNSLSVKSKAIVMNQRAFVNGTPTENQSDFCIADSIRETREIARKGRVG